MHQRSEGYIDRPAKPKNFKHKEKVWATKEASVYWYWWRVKKFNKYISLWACALGAEWTNETAASEENSDKDPGAEMIMLG